MLASAFALLLLACFTGGMVFYAAFAVFLIFIALDASRLFLSVSSLKRDLSLSSSLSRSEVPPGVAATYSAHASYHGRTPGIVLSIKPMIDDSIRVRPPFPGLRLRRGQERAVSVEIVPGKPGDYAIGAMQVHVSSLMFADSIVAGETKSLRVRLPLGEFMLRPNAVLPGYKSYAARTVGTLDKRHGSDFSGVRPYAPGDNARNIDWAISSRAGKPVVREFEEKRALPAYFLFDLSPAEFEAAAAIVSGLIGRRLAEGEKIGLICFSRSGLVRHVRPGMGREHIRRLSETLSKLQAVDDGVSAGPCVSVDELYDAGRPSGRRPAPDA